MTEQQQYESEPSIHETPFGGFIAYGDGVSSSCYSKAVDAVEAFKRGGTASKWPAVWGPKPADYDLPCPPVTLIDGQRVKWKWWVTSGTHPECLLYAPGRGMISARCSVHLDRAGTAEVARLVVRGRFEYGWPPACRWGQQPPDFAAPKPESPYIQERRLPEIGEWMQYEDGYIRVINKNVVNESVDATTDGAVGYWMFTREYFESRGPCILTPAEVQRRGLEMKAEGTHRLLIRDRTRRLVESLREPESEPPSLSEIVIRWESSGIFSCVPEREYLLPMKECSSGRGWPVDLEDYEHSKEAESVEKIAARERECWRASSPAFGGALYVEGEACFPDATREDCERLEVRS